MTGNIHEQLVKMKRRLESDKANAAIHRTSIITYKEKLKTHEATLGRLKESNSLFQQVGADTQSTVEVHIDGLVSSAHSAVFNDPYIFETKFLAKRNKTECVFQFVRDNNRMNPMASSGGGPVDITSLAELYLVNLYVLG